ncbi:Uncharacterised protein [Burkholderia pseudomallei]|nr:Uncharacterised protein [Burkholderia pseudomallei]CAJ5696588.1 Uncharacterised protein [Burkholderia pseudomallei]CAJ6761117.1 Uncharacterised protein [Burkholderia pseudomallei]VBM85218.1 Uncharacterised protein [Burkholderia pseudomallei]
MRRHVAARQTAHRSRLVVRGSWFVACGLWLVACGLWLTAHGSRLTAHGPRLTVRDSQFARPGDPSLSRGVRKGRRIDDGGRKGRRAIEARSRRSSNELPRWPPREWRRAIAASRRRRCLHLHGRAHFEIAHGLMRRRGLGCSLRCEKGILQDARAASAMCRRCLPHARRPIGPRHGDARYCRVSTASSRSRGWLPAVASGRPSRRSSRRAALQSSFRPIAAYAGARADVWARHNEATARACGMGGCVSSVVRRAPWRAWMRDMPCATHGA